MGKQRKEVSRDAVPSKAKTNARGKVSKAEPPAPARTTASSSKKNSKMEAKTKPLLVYLPGASGTVSKAHQSLLDSLSDAFDVRPLLSAQGRLWAVNSVASDKNLTAVKDWIGSCATPGVAWCLMAQSFGNRVAAELLRPAAKHFSKEGGEGRQLNIAPPRAFVAMGMPLYGPPSKKPVHERAEHFREAFPQDLRLLVVSGSKDEYITAHAPAGAKQGAALLEEQRRAWRCAATTEIHVVQGAGHGGLDAPKEARQAAEGAIRDFLLR